MSLTSEYLVTYSRLSLDGDTLFRQFDRQMSIMRDQTLDLKTVEACSAELPPDT